MKRLLFLVLASFLVLAACGQKEESKSEDKKAETKKKETEKDNKKKEDKKKENADKSNKEDKETAENSQQNNTNQEANNQQQVESQVNQQQVNQQQANEQQQANQQSDEYQPLTQEQMEANAAVAKQHGYTGIPNGDAGMIDYDESEVPQQNESQSDGPRSLREIKEDTGKGASEFTQAEIDEANAYAREH